jgi:hypothetical protein
MKKKPPITSNEFTENSVTDNLYRTILKELRTNPDGTPKKATGRKRNLPRETLHNFLFFLSMTGEYELSAESAGLPEKRRRKYMTESETFRAVASQAKSNVSLRSRISVARAIMGRKPSYYKIVHPATKQPAYIELKEILPNVNAAMWWLETVDKIGAVEQMANIPQLGAPRNEEEAKLLEMLLNKHADYISEKKNRL